MLVQFPAAELGKIQQIPISRATQKHLTNNPWISGMNAFSHEQKTNMWYECCLIRVEWDPTGCRKTAEFNPHLNDHHHNYLQQKTVIFH